MNGTSNDPIARARFLLSMIVAASMASACDNGSTQGTQLASNSPAGESDGGLDLSITTSADADEERDGGGPSDADNRETWAEDTGSSAPAGQVPGQSRPGVGDDLESKGFVLKTAQSAAEIFRWTSNERDIAMKPTSTHICFLTRVSGNLGGTSIVTVHHSQGNYSQGSWDDMYDGGTVWKIGGYQGEANSLVGEGTCVPKSAFFGDPNPMVVSTYAEVWLNPDWPGCSVSRTADMFGMRAMSYIAGVLGEFEGGGEYAEIVENYPIATWANPAKLRVGTEQCSTTEARAYSFGIRGGQMHRYYSRYGYAGEATPPYLRTTGGTKTVRLQKTKDAICFIQRISGSFDGAGERVRIYPKVESGVEWWMFEAAANGGTASATVNCTSYNVNQDFGPII